MSTMVDSNYLENKIFKIISETAEQLGVRAFVIGGYVRDCFLGRRSKDIDIVVEGKGIELAEAVAAATGSQVSVFPSFGTAMLKYHGTEVEFVGARKESYRRESRKPIVEDGTLEEDQLRRDFTINAMAFSLQKEDFGALVDPFNGIQDLAKGIIRTPLDPDQTYSDDPLRMVRAIRFATKLTEGEQKFEIIPESLASIKRNKDRMKILSTERIVEELNKILVTSRPSIGFQLLSDTGLMDYVLPEMEKLKGVETHEGRGHKDNFAHTLEVVDNVADMDWEEPHLWLRWAALLHDIAKPNTKRYDKCQGWTFHGHEVVGARMVAKIFKRLNMPQNEKLKYVQKLVNLHLRPISLVTEEVTDSAVRRLLFDAGDDIDDLMLLCHADITSKNQKKVQRLHKNFEQVKEKLREVEEKDAIRNFENPITGDYIMDLFGIEPSKIIGDLKEMVKNAILDGDIENSFEQADKYMREKALENGLTPVK